MNHLEQNNHTIDSELSLLLQELHLTDREGLYEITYAYRDVDGEDGKQGKLNTTIFCVLGGLGNEVTKEVFIEAYKQTKSSIEKAIGCIDGFCDIHQDGLDPVYKNALVYYKDLLLYALYALPYEGMKTGLISDDDVSILHSGRNSQENLTHLKAIDTKLFGGEVKDDPDESQYAKEKIWKEQASISEKGKLTTEELKEYHAYVDQICGEKQIMSFRSFSFSVVLHMKDAKLLSQVTGKLSRENYIKIFQLFLLACGIKKEVVVNNELSSVFDGQDALQIPGNDAYAKKTKTWVLNMMIHEIETHFFNEQNHDYLIRGGNHLPTEEGHAQGLELLFGGEKLDEIGYTISLPSILAGEVLSGDDFLRYSQLRGKGLHLKDNTIASYLRRKRGYPDHLPGVQHKDTSYSRGLREIKKRLEEGGDYKDLYLGKLSLADLKHAKQKKEESNSLPRIPQRLPLIGCCEERAICVANR